MPIIMTMISQTT